VITTGLLYILHPMSLDELLTYRWLGNPVRLWLLAVTLIVVATTVLWVLKLVAVKRLTALAKRTRTLFDDMLVDLLCRTRVPLIFVATVSPATDMLSLPTGLYGALRLASVVALLVQLGIWGNAFISFLADRYGKRTAGDNGAGTTALATMAVIARVLLGLLLFLFLLDNLGIDVTALIAGLGIGGVIVALALQGIVADMLGAMSILVSKPFVVGEVIETQGTTGTVEAVGLRATTIRTSSGDELIVPNKKLLGEPIRNHTRRSERRIEFRFGVTYDTPPEKLDRILSIAREAVERHPLVRFERAHFRALREWSLEFEVLYVVASPDVVVSADIQQQINLELVRRFEAEGISFARPTQVVEVKGMKSSAF
jgi:small-conductance mechanosensitive channel